MSLSFAMGLVMIAASVIAFAILHSVMRRIPWELTSPRERFRWPVFSWFPLVLISALVLSQGTNLWFTWRAEHRTVSASDTRRDIQPVRGTEPAAR